MVNSAASINHVSGAILKGELVSLSGIYVDVLTAVGADRKSLKQDISHCASASVMQ